MLSEVPDKDDVNEYLQLEPLYTNPNLHKYTRQLKPKSGDVERRWDIFEWNDIFVCDPTNFDDQSKIAEKFEVLAG